MARPGDADEASLPLVQEQETRRIQERLARHGLSGYVERVEGATVHGLVFAAYWSQANQWKPGQELLLSKSAGADAPAGEAPAAAVKATLRTRRNLGTYGSGPSEIVLELADPAAAKQVQSWQPPAIIQFVPAEAGAKPATGP